MQNFIPDIQITNHFKLGYFKSLLCTEINLNNLDNLENYKKIILQHEINSKFYKKQIASITTKILNLDLEGLNDVVTLEQIKNLQLTTEVGFNNDIISILKEIKINHDINPISYKINNSSNTKHTNINIKIHEINFFYNSKANKLNLFFNIPKLVYTEGDDKLAIENLNLKLNANSLNDAINRTINISTAINKLYLINSSKPVLRLSNFNIEQSLGRSLVSNLSFLKLNILERKFGPLISKWQLNNLFFPPLFNILNNIEVITLPELKEKLNNHNFIELASSLLKNQPNLSLDLLLHVGNEKVKILSDVIVNSNDLDHFTSQDLLDSLNINIAAKLPKSILFDLVTILMREKQKKTNKLQLMYNSNNKTRRNLPKAYLSQDPKEAEKELEGLIYEKIAYLIKNNIIVEEQYGFSLDLSIAEGTFYSRMNPFNIFSF